MLAPQLQPPPDRPPSRHKQNQRVFQPVWQDEFKSWLRWDAAREAMFCSVCERYEGRAAKGNNKVRPVRPVCCAPYVSLHGTPH